MISKDSFLLRTRYRNTTSPANKQRLHMEPPRASVSEEECAECSVSGELTPGQDVLCPRCREMFKLLEKEKEKVKAVDGAGALSLLQTEETRRNNLEAKASSKENAACRAGEDGLKNKQSRPTSRKIHVPTAILAPYR